MEWESIKKKWAEMTLRVRFPALPANTNTTKGPARAGNQDADAPKGQSGALPAHTPDERSTV